MHAEREGEFTEAATAARVRRDDQGAPELRASSARCSGCRAPWSRAELAGARRGFLSGRWTALSPRIADSKPLPRRRTSPIAPFPFPLSPRRQCVHRGP